MRTVFTWFAIVLLAGCGEIGLRQKNVQSGPSLFQAAMQLGIEGYWQLSENGNAGWVVQVGSSKVSFEGKTFSAVTAGADGIFSNATLLGVSVVGDQNAGPQVTFLLLDHGSAGVYQCGPSGCTSQNPVAPFKKVEAHAITAVQGSTLTIAGDHADEAGGTMTRLATPPALSDALTLASVIRDLSAMWMLQDTRSGASWIIVVGTTKITFDGTTFFKVTAGGSGIEGEALLGVSIDQIEGRPRLRILFKSQSGEHIESVDVLSVFDGYITLSDDALNGGVETGRMIHL